MAEKNFSFSIDESRKKELIDKLTDELVVLRAKAGIAQEDLARIIGVTRQTYGNIERKGKPMSWGTYLSLIFFFEHNNQTALMLRQSGIFPDDIIVGFNNGKPFVSYYQSEKIDPTMSEMIENLDEQGIHSLKTFLMVEYARCKKLPGDYVVKAFNGKSFNSKISEGDVNTQKALKRIREKRKNNE